MLACPPDGIIDEGGEVVEIKCPFSAKDKSAEEAQLAYLVEHPTKGKAIKEISVLVAGAGPAEITDYIIIIYVVDVNDGNRTGPYIMTDIIKVCSSSIQYEQFDSLVFLPGVCAMQREG